MDSDGRETFSLNAIEQGADNDELSCKRKTRQSAAFIEEMERDSHPSQKEKALKYFEYTTLSVISLNALWMSIDVELNDHMWTDENCHPVFAFMEHFFCAYFTIELVIRFFLFKKKSDCLRDRWFMFDSFLVSFMLVETWVVAFLGGADFLSKFSLLRLLRLLRLTRMAKLMAFCPELLTLVKAMVAALQSVGATLILLVACLYIFGIVFTMRYRDGGSQEWEQNLQQDYFGGLWVSVITLLVHGTLLDDITSVFNELRKDVTYMLVFIGFIVLSSFTVLNMLVGVLAEVVTQTADSEKFERNVSETRRHFHSLFLKMDMDASGSLSQVEFERMLEDKKAVKLLSNLGIKKDRCVELKKQIFEDVEARIEAAETPNANVGSEVPRREIGRAQLLTKETCTLPGKELEFPDFLDELLALMPPSALSTSAKVSVKDLATLRRLCSTSVKRVDQGTDTVLGKLEAKIEQLNASMSKSTCSHCSARDRSFSSGTTSCSEERPKTGPETETPSRPEAAPSPGELSASKDNDDDTVISKASSEVLIEELRQRMARTRQKPMADKASQISAWE